MTLKFATLSKKMYNIVREISDMYGGKAMQDIVIAEAQSLLNYNTTIIGQLLDDLVENDIIEIVKFENKFFYKIKSVFPIDGKNEVDIMNQTVNKKGNKVVEQKGNKVAKLNCTPEQKAFAKLVKDNKGVIYDANQVLTHRGAQVLFGGCGDKSLRYKIAVSGFSDKEEVEYAIMYLDWDDSALYDEGGLADQIREIVGEPEPEIVPVISAIGVQGAK